MNNPAKYFYRKRECRNKGGIRNIFWNNRYRNWSCQIIPIKMTTSQKHRDFEAERMGGKPVGSLAGTEEVLGKKMEERGFDKAFVVLGQFLALKKDEVLFQEWLKDTCSTNAKQSQDCFRCL